MPTSGWRDDEYIAAWSGLLRLHAQLVPPIDEQLERITGVSLAWYDVLLELSAAPERRMRMSDLGAAVVLSRTRVSRIVDELVAMTYVARSPNPDDRRSALATLTPGGYRAFRQAAPVYLDLIRAQLSTGLSSNEARNLQRLLEKALGSAGRN